MKDQTLEQIISSAERTALDITRFIESKTKTIPKILNKFTKTPEDINLIIDKYQSDLKEIEKIALEKLEEKNKEIQDKIEKQEELNVEITIEMTAIYENGFNEDKMNYREAWDNEIKKDKLKLKVIRNKKDLTTYQAEEAINRIQVYFYRTIIEDTRRLYNKKIPLIKDIYKTVEDEGIYTNTIKESLKDLLYGTRGLNNLLINKKKAIVALSKESVEQASENDKNLSVLTTLEEFKTKDLKNQEQFESWNPDLFDDHN